MRRFVGLFLLLPLSAWAQSPFDGTWKFNMSSAQFAEKPDTFALHNGEYTCSTCIPNITVTADGADHKVAGEKDYDTLAISKWTLASCSLPARPLVSKKSTMASGW